MTVSEPDVVAVEAPRRKRPFGVTAVVILSVVQALALMAIGVAANIAAGNADVREALEVDTATTVRAVGVVVIVVGLAEVVFAVLLARGSERARSVFGILNSFHVATAVYGMVALREVRAEGVWALVLPVGVLWFLYGSQGAKEFFEP